MPLYIVATPIGNLEDITLRAIRTFKEVDFLVCEDSRTTQKILNHYVIKTKTMPLYRSVKTRGSRKPDLNIENIIREIKNGKNAAFVTDAGTPGISDPGNQLVAEAIKNNLAVIPISGVSAVTTLGSVSGIDLSRFVFLGFPPHKKGRETFFKEVAAFSYPVIYFESPHRVIKNLELLKNLAPNKNIILGRELTKMFEEIIRGNAREILNYFKDNPEKIKGEFTIISY